LLGKKKVFTLRIMAKAAKQHAAPKAQVASEQQTKTKVKTSTEHNSTSSNIIKYLPWLVLAFTAICHSVGIFNGFVNWDDELYLIQNEAIRTLDLESIKKMFALTSVYGGNYHPLVALSNAIEYSIAGLDPQLYHIVNLVLHLLNTFLVFIFIKKLTRGNDIVAALVSVLFGVHPMHVESVAWLSERKDVLYSLFYLLAMNSYMKFKEGRGSLQIILSLIFFVLSLLSKSMAVTLPVVLVAIDYFYDESFSLKKQLNKVPFFALSLLFGILTIQTQSAQNYVGAYNYNFLEKVLISTYALMYYVVKMILPIQLSTLVPFPRTGIPVLYYLGPVFVAVLAFLSFKIKGEAGKLLRFGLWFYVGSIFVVLQFVSVGAAVVCERYTYMPYIGLFFIAAMFLHRYLINNPSKTKMFNMLTLAIVAVLGIATFLRTQVWKDGVTLWRDTTQKNGETADYAWYGLGNALNEQYKNYIAENYPRGVPNPIPADVAERRKEILDAYNTSTKINDQFPNYLLNGAAAKSDFGLRDEALKDYNRAIQLNPNFDQALYNRGIMRNENGDFAGAIEDYTKALAVKSTYQTYFNRAISYKAMNRFDEAIADYKKVIELNPEFINAYTNLGNVYFGVKQYEQALIYYNQALAKQPTDANSLRNRGAVYLSMGNKQQACADFAAAAANGSEPAKQDIMYLCK
jgi:protein O-mannosyl-transferase